MADSDPRTDMELVAAANGSDPSAFEVLYLRHQDWVLGLAFRLTGDRDEAQDVLQETFAALLRRFPGFRLTARMTTWLYPVVRGLCAAARRRRPLVVETGDVAAESADPDGPAVAHAVAAVLATLPEHLREVLILRFVDGLDLKEIGSALEIPLGTVKSRLHNGLKRLRDDPRTESLLAP